MQVLCNLLVVIKYWWSTAKLYNWPKLLIYSSFQKARDEDWTRDLTLTKGVLYHWATRAKLKS
jgi:hypothetical protein